jgi:hypothetical protein
MNAKRTWKLRSSPRWDEVGERSGHAGESPSFFLDGQVDEGQVKAHIHTGDMVAAANSIVIVRTTCMVSLLIARSCWSARSSVLVLYVWHDLVPGAEEGADVLGPYMSWQLTTSRERWAPTLSHNFAAASSS